MDRGRNEWLLSRKRGSSSVVEEDQQGDGGRTDSVGYCGGGPASLGSDAGRKRGGVKR